MDLNKVLKSIMAKQKNDTDELRSRTRISLFLSIGSIVLSIVSLIIVLNG